MTPTQPSATSQSFEKSAIPLALARKPSRVLRVASALCHAAAALAILLAAIPLSATVIALALIAASAFYNYQQDSRPQALIWRAGNRWVIEATGEQTDTSAELHRIDFLSRWLVILTLRRQTGRTVKFVIPYDALSKDTFRLLRVRLRIEGYFLLNPHKDPHQGPH